MTRKRALRVIILIKSTPNGDRFTKYKYMMYCNFMKYSSKGYNKNIWINTSRYIDNNYSNLINKK